MSTEKDMVTKKIELECNHLKGLINDKVTTLNGQIFKRYRLIEETDVDKTYNKLSREAKEYSTPVTCSGNIYFFKEGDEKTIYLVDYSCSGNNINDAQDVTFDSSEFTAFLVPPSEKKTIPKKDSIKVEYHPKESIKSSAAKKRKSKGITEFQQTQKLQSSVLENMSRDYFAGQAFQTLLKMSLENKWRGSNEDVCEEAYYWADLMLDARDKF